MSGATRFGDKSTGHDTCSPTSLATASSDVYINGRGAGRVTDSYNAHSCIIHTPHKDHISSGSNSVLINGLPAGRIGDPVSIAGKVAEGSDNVFIGG